MASGCNFSRRDFIALALSGVTAHAAGIGVPPPGDLGSICHRMEAADKWRTENLRGYSVKRRYRLRLGSSEAYSEMVARMDYTYPGHKVFEVISTANSGYVEDRIFRQVMNAEMQAARDDIRHSTLLLPCNYDFQVLGTSAVAGRPAYLLRMKPKRKQRFLLDGKIWVDMEDATVTRVDGEVAPSSFWVHSVHMVQDYERVGPYWLVASIQNEASVRLLGQASMEIQNYDYQLSPA